MNADDFMGDADNLFLKIEKKSLASQTKQAIRNLIQKKRPDYLPSERKMEELLQVSRTTIRNALKELEMEKRLLPLHGKGYRVLYPDTRGTVTGRIGIAVPLHSDDFLQSVFFHLLKAVLGFGFQPAVVPFEGRNREKTNDKLSLLASECDGLILFSTLLDIGDVNLVLHDYLNRCVMIPYTYGDFSGGRVYADLDSVHTIDFFCIDAILSI